MTPLIVIDAKAKKAFVREVAALEDCAADGNTWGPEQDARILSSILLGGARLNKRDADLLYQCVMECRDDLRERLREYPQDYDDHRFTQRRIDAMTRLLARLEAQP
jgi:hypothetical protein